MKHFIKTWGLLICVLVIAAAFRFYRLSSVPPSPSLDEVSIGYNAYSILKTGADEYGTKFPLLLRAYDDWRPALYVYFVIPFVWIFGLTAAAVRLPSVILSVVTVYVTYLLAKEIFGDKHYSVNIGKLTIDAPLVVSMLLAISPWHIYLSRLGHEVNLGLAFVVIGTFFFLRAVHDNKHRFFLIYSSIFFGLSFYTYQSEKIIVPVFVILLFIIFGVQLMKRKKEILIAGIIGLLLTLPIFLISLSPEARIRFTSTSAFINNPAYDQSARQLLKAKEDGNVIGTVLNNRRIVTLKIFSNNYFSHFNPQWLFFGGNMESHKVPGLGLLYPWEAPLILLGFVFFTRKFSKQIYIFLIAWLLVSPLAASLTTQAPHAMRSYTFLPAWQIFTVGGIFLILEYLKKIKIYVLLTGFILIFVSAGYFYVHYFVLFPKLQSVSFQYALSQAIPFVVKNQNQYQKIIFSNKDNLYQSYMFFLFFNRYDPATYLSQGGTKSGGYDQTHEFGKFEFRPILWDNELKNKQTLYIGNVSDFPANVQTLFVGSNLDEKPAVLVVQ